MLRKLGCNCPIKYKMEEFKSVLKAKYPKGIDIVYESISGELYVFDTCVTHLAIGGRLILICFITSYQDSNFALRPGLPLYQILLSISPN